MGTTIWCKIKEYRIDTDICPSCTKRGCKQKPKLILQRENISNTMYIGKTTRGELREINIDDIKNPTKEEVDGFEIIYDIKAAYKPVVKTGLEQVKDNNDGKRKGKGKV